MRLRVEIEWQGRPWRRRLKVHKLAVVDAVLGVLVALLYVVKLSFPDSIEPELPALSEEERCKVLHGRVIFCADLKTSIMSLFLPVNNTLALVFLVAANVLQTFHASRLAYTVNKEEKRDPAICFEASKTWYDFTQFSYLFSTVKCVITISYLIKVAAHPWVLALVALTLPECVFKMWILYTVYGFMKDLKESLKYMPKFRFFPCHEEEERGGGKQLPPDERIDLNANMALLP